MQVKLLRVLQETEFERLGGSETIRVVPRGTDRAESFGNFLNIKFSKRVSVGQSAFIEPIAEVFNIFNASTVQIYQQAIGGAYGNPTRLLAPITLRIGLKWVF